MFPSVGDWGAHNTRTLTMAKGKGSVGLLAIPN